MATGYSIPQTLTDDDGNVRGGITLQVTGPGSYAGTVVSDATTGVFRLGPLEVAGGAAFADYTVTLGARSAVVPVFVSTAAAGVGGALSVSDAAVALGTSYLPAQLTMRQVSNQRSFDWPISPRSPGLIAWDPAVGTDLTRYGRYTRAGTPTTTASADGGITVTASAGGVATVDFVSGDRPQVLAFAAEVTIKAGFVAADIDAVAVGLHKQDGTAGLWAYYNGTGFGIFSHGTGPTNGTASPTQPTAFTPDTTQDLTVGIYLTEPNAVAYVRQGGRTVYVTGSAGVTLTGSAAAMRTPATWRDWRLAFTLSPKASKSMTATNFAAAYMPGDSFSNPRIVTYKDGSPYTRDGKYYLTGTIHTSGSFRDHSSGLFSFDPVTYKATLVSHLFAKSGNDVLHLGPGGLVYDDDTETWLWLISTWGSTGSVALGVDLLLGTTTRDVVAGGVFIIPCTTLNLGTKSYYDAAARWDAAASKWRVGLTESGSRTGWTGNQAAYYEGSTLSSLAFVRKDTAHDAYQDGGQWAKIGGVWYLIYGGQSSFIAFDENLTAASHTALSSWSANVPTAIFNNFGTYMPHAALLAVPDEGSTRYLALCYGADLAGPTSIRGSLVVLEADEKPTGYEHPRRRLLRAS